MLSCLTANGPGTSKSVRCDRTPSASVFMPGSEKWPSCIVLYQPTIFVSTFTWMAQHRVTHSFQG